LFWEDPARTLVIDPGAEPEAIEAALARQGLSVGAYWLTHGHIDHLSAISELLAAHPAPVYLHAEDAAWAFTAVNRYPPYLRVPLRPDALRPLCAGPAPDDCGLAARVLHTPGHTPGGVCFLFEKDGLLATGDTLFQGSVGRTDLPGGDWTVLASSLRLLLALPDALRVLPGHGPDSTLGEERHRNPFLRELQERR
jgi:glyoxylase-like metal-dependent hydrolase (beta-lactamase superfamily II)